jgi:hypothetical protein
MVFEFLLSTSISEVLMCSIFTFHVNIVLLIDALQLLKLFVETLTYLEPNGFS